ncbi:MAG: TetR/AcrR family transcriptional regulator [Myxococcales bacterium]|nr:TetR/AcrR family transcriptional regulator [Myxococcales bacterium]
MAVSRRSSEVRQVELTDAALQIIATQGITALSTRTLAEHVGLSSGALFRHFPSLDALLEAVVARVESVLDATYPPGELPARDRLDRFVEARSAAVGQRVGMLRLMLSEQFLLALPKSSSARLESCVDKTRSFVHCAVREGQATGEIRADIDASALAAVVMGTTQMLALSTTNPRHGGEAQTVRDGLSALLRPVATRISKKHKKVPTKQALPRRRRRTKETQP